MDTSRLVMRTFGADEMGRSGALRPYAKLVKDVWWSIEDNTILFVRPLGEKAYHYRFDSDFWLPGLFERRLFRSLVRSMYGVDIGDRPLLFNRVSLGDYAVAVYGEGLRLGILVHDGFNWRLKATGALASILAELGASRYRVDARGRLKGKKIRLNASTEHLIVESGGYVGPAERVAEGVYRVRDMAPKGFRLLRASTLDDIVERNAAYLKRLESEAVGFIKRLDPGEQVYVAFSGGADSTAALLLAVEALGAGRVVAVYVDTGIEFPETRRHVERIASKLGVDLVVVESEGRFWREIARRKPPSRDSRWCTAILKIEPLRLFYSRLKPKLIIEGVRGFESLTRLTLGDVTRSPVAPTARRAFPIYEWSRLEVQLYLRWKRVELNPLYDEGLTRIGCIVCPAMHMYELFEVARRRHPALFEGIIERYAAILGRDMVMDGSWRFAGRGRPRRLLEEGGRT